MADRVTVAEAAAILGVSEDVVRKRLQRGTLNFGASATSDAPNTFSWYDIGKR